MQAGDFALAEARFRRVLAELEGQGPTSLNAASEARQRLGQLLHWRGQYSESDEAMRAARDGFVAIGGALNPRAAVTTAIWAGALRERFEFETEQRMLEEGLERWERAYGPEFPQVAWFRSELAMSHLARGDLDSAESLLGRARQSLEGALSGRWGPQQSQIRGALGAVLRNLATVLDRKGKGKQAVELYRRSLPLTREAFGRYHPMTGLITSYLGIFLAHHGRLEEAGEMLRDARNIYSASLPDNHPAFLGLLLKQGALSLDAGDAPTAVQNLRDAIALAERNRSSQQALVLTMLAEAHEAAGDLPEALLVQQRALVFALKQNGRLHPSTHVAWKGLARLATRSGDAQLALEAQREAAEASEEVLSRVLMLGSERQRRSYVARRGLRAETDAIIGFQLKHAANAANAALPLEALKLAFTTVLRRKGRALEASADAMLSLRRQLSAEARPLFEELQRQRGAAAALVLRGPLDRQTRTDFQRSLAVLNERADELERQLGGRARFAAPAATTLAAAQASLPPDSVLLEFVKYNPTPPAPAQAGSQPANAPSYALYILPAVGQAAAFDLGSARTIDPLIVSLRARLARRSSDWRGPARALYERLIRPASAYLTPSARLFIAPDSSLNLVPFAVFLDDQQQPLLATHPLSYLSSGRDRLRALPHTNPLGPPLVIAAPNYDAFASGQRAENGLLRHVRFSPLPGTLNEASRIASLFGNALVHTRDDASESVLRAARSPAFLHVATHAFFFDGSAETEDFGTRGILLAGPTEPQLEQQANAAISPVPAEPLLRSGVALAGANHGGALPTNDGVMTALELTTLELEGTELVTLSACDTALGEVRDAEGVFGLRRALVLAGARSQLLSLWRVQDQPTQALMADFYRGLAHGEAPSAALREVQLDRLRHADHPYYWAAFVLSGEDEPLTTSTTADGRR